MKKSDQINELAAAMASAQGQFTAAERDYTAKVATRKGGEYSFNYADLAAYLDVCRGPLSDNGIAVFQEPVADGRKARVTTLIVHKSGQWIEFDPLELEIAFKEQGEIPTPQEMGSLITYARRYSQSAALNMASEQDDDGNQASGNQATTGKRAPKPPCPKCNKSDHVYEDRQKGGFFCWKQKGGCGHNWLPEEDKPSEEPPVESKADKKKLPATKPEKDGAGTADTLAAQAAEGTFMTYLEKAQDATSQNKLRTWLLEKKAILNPAKLKAMLGVMHGSFIERTPDQDHDRFEELNRFLEEDKPLMEQSSWVSYGLRIDRKRGAVGAA